MEIREKINKIWQFLFDNSKLELHFKTNRVNKSSMAGIRAVTALLEELSLRTGDPELASEDEDILRQKLNGLGQRERVRKRFCESHFQY